mmetsp:Transcript_4837/g.7531  ORF Transcript_4837/g.7531 Transcript_4837/m.7531 type:complete len:274 (-) Transcript_4837:150-971(-)
MFELVMLHGSLVKKHDTRRRSGKISFLFVAFNLFDGRNNLLHLLLGGDHRLTEFMVDIFVHLEVIALGMVRVIIVMMMSIIIFVMVVEVVMSNMLVLEVLFLSDGMSLGMNVIQMTRGRRTIEVAANAVAVRDNWLFGVQEINCQLLELHSISKDTGFLFFILGTFKTFCGGASKEVASDSNTGSNRSLGMVIPFRNFLELTGLCQDKLSLFHIIDILVLWGRRPGKVIPCTSCRINFNRLFRTIIPLCNFLESHGISEDTVSFFHISIGNRS